MERFSIQNIITITRFLSIEIENCDECGANPKTKFLSYSSTIGKKKK